MDREKKLFYLRKGYLLRICDVIDYFIILVLLDLWYMDGKGIQFKETFLLMHQDVHHVMQSFEHFFRLCCEISISHLSIYDTELGQSLID